MDWSLSRPNASTNNSAAASVRIQAKARGGTVIAIADEPDGPFILRDKDRPHTPWDFMALDGTLYVDPDGKPWMVYAHEWVQKIDGTFEAIRLEDDLGQSVGEPIHLFKASDAPWRMWGSMSLA